MLFKAELAAQDKISTLEIVRSFASAHYPNLQLESKMIEQLLWLQENSISTSQSNIQVQAEPINLEVKRSLSRLYCLRLLEKGCLSSYMSFIQAQLKDKALSEHSFNLLSAFIQGLSPTERQTLMATCFITKSDQAIMAIPSERRRNLPVDSEQFISHAVSHYPLIFPISELLSPEALDLLPYAFYKGAHFRHLLDMEGGENMLSSLKEGIRLKDLTKEKFNLWLARWLINIAGLEGHIGSAYLTEAVANCIFALKLELEQLWENIEHPVLRNYLSFREKQLSVSSPYLAYLGALMRQCNPNIGREIQAWFENLDEREQNERVTKFEQELKQIKITPSFKPVLLNNLLSLGCPVAETLNLFIEISSKAMQIYASAIIKKQVSSMTPLSFRNIAYKENLLLIQSHYKIYKKLPELELDSGGYLMLPEAKLSFSEKVIFDIQQKGEISASDFPITAAQLQAEYALAEAIGYEALPQDEDIDLIVVLSGRSGLRGHYLEEKDKHQLCPEQYDPSDTLHRLNYGIDLAKKYNKNNQLKELNKPTYLYFNGLKKQNAELRDILKKEGSFNGYPAELFIIDSIPLDNTLGQVLGLSYFLEKFWLNFAKKWQLSREPNLILCSSSYHVPRVSLAFGENTPILTKEYWCQNPEFRKLPLDIQEHLFQDKPFILKSAKLIVLGCDRHFSLNPHWETDLKNDMEARINYSSQRQAKGLCFFPAIAKTLGSNMVGIQKAITKMEISRALQESKRFEIIIHPSLSSQMALLYLSLISLLLLEHSKDCSEDEGIDFIKSYNGIP